MEIITIHSAKGLEWPVVIPINMGSELRRLEPFIHRRHDDTLHTGRRRTASRLSSEPMLIGMTTGHSRPFAGASCLSPRTP